MNHLMPRRHSAPLQHRPLDALPTTLSVDQHRMLLLATMPD
jgi:hypothetical protein